MFKPKQQIESPPLSDKIVIRKGENGERKQTIRAHILYKDRLAIHGTGKAWVLTHIPTGYRINRVPYDCYGDALRVAQLLKEEFESLLKTKDVEILNKKYKKLSRVKKARLTVIIKRKRG